MIDRPYVESFSNIYQEPHAKINTYDYTKGFLIIREVQTWDVSPLALNSNTRNMFHQLDWNKNFFAISGEYLKYLRLADDISLRAKIATELQALLNDLVATSNEISLKIKLANPKVMYNELIHTTPQPGNGKRLWILKTYETQIGLSTFRKI